MAVSARRGGSEWILTCVRMTVPEAEGWAGSGTAFHHFPTCARPVMLAAMTEPRHRSPRRAHADYRWTRDKMLAFLTALARSGSVSDAAAAVGMSRQSAYRLRARLGAGFAAVWDEGIVIAQQARAARIAAARARRMADRAGLTGPRTR